ncbi:MAG: TonB-dependent receptor [Bacteroidales bacterium]|nr:TonB-dependent receptor [Bacteroidales bacterium]
MKKNLNLWMNPNPILKKFLAELKIAFLIIVVSVSNILAVSAGTELQQKKISGTVTEKNGTPIAGASVVVTGTTQGTITDINGKYSINVPPEAKSLTFSFVGMEPQAISIGASTQIDATLNELAIGLNEVVVIGYGTAKKADLTGSVASIQGDVLSERNAIKVTNALQGAISGVTVTRSGAAPGADATVQIRGVTTIGNSDPLVIIDGIPGSLSGINPNDIESISVLKDAASASIYGSKAAAGVILITTKRAKTGQLSLGYNYEYGFDSPTRIPQHISATPYLKMANELIWNDAGNTGTEYPTYAKDFIDSYDSKHAENPDKYPDTDWTQYINNNAPRQSHTLSITAGENHVLTQASISYDKVEALTSGRSYERINARVNNDVTINKALVAHLDFQYLNSLDQRESSGSLSPSMLTREPTMAAFWSDGRVADARNGESPWALLLRSGTNKAWSDGIRGKIALDFSPIKGLKLSGIFAPTYNFYKNKVHVQQTTMSAWDDPTLITGFVRGAETTKLTEYRNDSKSYTTQFLANYLKDFGRHSLNLLAGYENFYSFNENLSASRDQYALSTFPYLNLGPLAYRDNSGSAYEYASRSYFGRVMYNYNNRYLFQANARYDGSSRFYKDYRWGLFPSFSAGWVISEESFMKDVPVISFLKLRASWGTLGNERIGNYPYQSTVAFSNALFYQGANVISNQTAYIPQYAIKDISWETTESLDFGFDANFFENKLQVTADYFHKKTKDMLLALDIPDYIGLSKPNQNTGEMSTNGWEVEIRYNNKIGDLNYSVSANLFDSKSVMGDLGGTEFLGTQVKFKGSEFNEWYGYEAEGLYQTQDEVDNSAKINNRVKPGDVKYRDISGPNGEPDGIISATYDRALLGGSLPRYQYGGNIRLDYKNFDFSLIFQGVGEQNSYLSTTMVQPLVGGVYAIPSFIPGNYWSKYNTDDQNQKVFYPRLSEIASGGQSISNGNNYVTSDYWLFNGRYFRLKNIVLGYSLPEDLVKGWGIQSIRVYGNLSDLFSIDKFPQGWDPETSSGGYFITKSYIFGVAVKF